MLLTLSTEYLPSDYTLMCSIPDTDIDITEVTLNFWLEREKLQFITTHFYTIHNVCTRNYSCNTVKAHILPHSTLHLRIRHETLAIIVITGRNPIARKSEVKFITD
jgi:hypothetical protein